MKEIVYRVHSVLDVLYDNMDLIMDMAKKEKCPEEGEEEGKEGNKTKKFQMGLELLLLIML